MLNLTACGEIGSPFTGGIFSMKKSVFVVAVIAAACSSVAFAGEVKKDKAPVVKATTMNNAELERVSAGAAANLFTDSNGITIKETGSILHGNGGTFNGDHGAFNQNVHVPNK
jgi:hypothetical protein